MKPFDPNDIVLARKPMPYDHRDYRLSDFITPEIRKRAEELTFQDWGINDILDQGSTPHCVGFAWAGFGNSSPVMQAWPNQKGHDIYYQAKIYDGEPGEENGSTTRSGVKAFMHFGMLKDNAYAFASSMQDIITWVLAVGPVVTGTNWYETMFYPDDTGLIYPDGRAVGGHEWMISGVDTVKRLFHCTNSWGVNWGRDGQFYIGFGDYQRLLNEQGDAVTTAEIFGNVPPNGDGCLPKVFHKLYRLSM